MPAPPRCPARWRGRDSPPAGCGTLCLMWRSLLAVFGGWIVIQVLVVAADEALFRVSGVRTVAGMTPPDWLVAVRLVCGGLFSAVGGWLTARLAPERPWRHAAYLILIGVTLGLFTGAASLGQVQWWYLAGMLLLFPVAVLAGAWFFLRGPGPGAGRTAAP